MQLSLRPAKRHLTILAFIVLPAVVGCRKADNKPVAVTQPFAEKTLKIAVADGPARLILERQGRAWAHNQRVSLEIKLRKTGDAVTEDTDVIAFSPEEMGKLIDAKALAPLPSVMTEGSSWTQFTRPYQTKLLGWGDGHYALPLIGDASILIYRADVFEQAKRKPPTTIREYLELAKFFAEERKRPSLPRLADDDALEREFYLAAASIDVQPLNDANLTNRPATDSKIIKSYGFHFDIETGKPRVASPAFQSALSWLVDCQPFRATNGTFVEAFSRGDAIFGLGTMADLAALVSARHSHVYAVAPILASPTGEIIPYFGAGGVIAAVTATSKSPDAARALLTHLSDLQNSLEVVHSPEYGAAPYRIGHLSERSDGWFNWGFNRTGTDALCLALNKFTNPRVINAPIRLRVREEAKYRRVLIEGIRSAVDHNLDAIETLKDISQKWETLDPRSAEERRDEYLRSLNLRR